MSRRKRSEKIAEGAVAVKPAPAVAPVRVETKVVACLCPICGRAVPENRAVKIGTMTIGKVGYFDSIDWDPNKPFGVVYEASGRGSFKTNQHISPEEAPELFEATKQRFLSALGEWLQKRWINSDEVKALLE